VDADPPLVQTLARLAEGDLSVRDRLVEACAERLRHLTHKLLRRYPVVRRFDDTDDVFQGAILRLHRAIGQMATAGESPRSLMALGATQIHRELVDLARRYSAASSYEANRGTNVYQDADGERRFIDSAEVEEEPLDRWERFHAAIDRLSPEQREVFRLVWYMGADQRTIAGMLGCSERTVKTYWRNARDGVRAALDGEGPE
jgi:RNA polymerase sigma factor (sigma-70 family)